MKEIKNFISSKESDELIEFHKKNFNLNTEGCLMHRNTEVISWTLLTKFKNLEKALTKFAKNVNNNYVINSFEIVKWPTGESQPNHLDFNFHPYTSIIYLNDNYEGGETVVENKTIVPEKNKLVSFEGDKMIHKVNEIIKGTRYTVPCWYRYES